MNRLAIGAALGGLAAYLYDPQLGSKRRARLSALWEENREGVLQAASVASETIDSARPQVQRMTNAIGRTDWTQVLNSRRRTSKVPMLLGAAAVGGVVAYFLDPLRGSGRRLSALESGRRAVRQLARVPATIAAHTS